MMSHLPSHLRPRATFPPTIFPSENLLLRVRFHLLLLSSLYLSFRPLRVFFRILFICPRFMSHAGRQACRNIFARTHTHTPVGHTHYPWVCVYYMRYEYVCVHYDVGGGWNFLQHRKCSTTLVWHMNYILIIQPASVGFRIRNLHCKGTPEI